jgi:dTDP-L-rhamnose 4-epimerase
VLNADLLLARAWPLIPDTEPDGPANPRGSASILSLRWVGEYRLRRQRRARVHWISQRYDPAVQILITGGAGFIGSRLSAALADAADVVIFDSFHPQVHAGVDVDLSSDVAIFAADVRDPDAWDRYFRRYGKPDVVVHLAAETGTGQSLVEASRHGSTNVVGTTQMTDALVRHGCVPAQIILASSRAVYGEGAWWADDGQIFHPPPRTGEQLAAARWDPPSPIGGGVQPLAHRAATTWPRPTNVYAATKLAQEHLLGSWCSAFGVPLSVLRLQNVYGPGQAVGNSYTGVLTFFARQIASNEQVEVYEDGHILRDFVYVGDVVDALSRAMSTPPVDVRRIDIGGGRSVSLLEVATTMCSIAGAAPPIVTGNYSATSEPPSPTSPMLRQHSAGGPEPSCMLA